VPDKPYKSSLSPLSRDKPVTNSVFSVLKMKLYSLRGKLKSSLLTEDPKEGNPSKTESVLYSLELQLLA
ncbi:MAG: hypothetical protein OXE52_03135, partial [Chloroflexi bacterium]|nr:hypothetical protein [Chloroflexota bacterium]